MALLTLKRYQEHALQELDKYLRAARLTGPRLAFEAQTGFGYNTEPFGEIPCVCLRIPTGGGKTLMAAEAIGRMAREWSNGLPQPLVLWLVPSDTIRSQTLSACAHPATRSGKRWRKVWATRCACANSTSWPRCRRKTMHKRP